MRYIVPIVFLVVAVGGIFGLTMFQASTKTADAGEDGAGLMGSILDKVVSDFTPSAKPKDVDVAQFLPVHPEGWFGSPYKTTDGEELTNATYRNSMVVIDTTNTRLARFESAKSGRLGAAMTYSRGSEKVLVAVNARSDRDMKSLQGSMITAIAGNISAMSGINGGSGGWGSNDFARLYGITFTEAAQKNTTMATRTDMPVNYRSFGASMGGQVSFDILTNASDASVAAIIREIDIQGLNAAMTEPDPRVTPATGFVTRQEGQLSTALPEPSPAYKAYQMLRSGTQVSPIDARFLTMVAEFKFTTWFDVFDEYGHVDEISADALAILGAQPELSPEQRRKNLATYYLRDVLRWEDHETKVLEAIRSERLQYQSERPNYFDIDAVYAPEIMVMLQELPERPPRDPRHVSQARQYLATPDRWHPFENAILRGIVDGEVTSRQQASAISTAAMTATGTGMMHGEIVDLLRSLPDNPTQNQAALAQNGNVPVVRRGGQVRQGESLGGNCTKNELGVRQCVLGAEEPQRTD